MEVFCVLPFMAINQLKAGAFLSYISIGLNNIVGLLYTPYMLRMLGQNEYGLYSLVASVVAYLTILDLGFANAIVRYTAKLMGRLRNNMRCLECFLSFILLLGLLLFP
jgi:O-antigen/teichoic acid export membrane protein